MASELQEKKQVPSVSVTVAVLQGEEE